MKVIKCFSGNGLKNLRRYINSAAVEVEVEDSNSCDPSWRAEMPNGDVWVLDNPYEECFPAVLKIFKGDLCDF